jgi:hypothetical protein
VAKGKPNDEKAKDAQRRDDQMVEGKNPEVVAAIYRGGKYYCAECHSELPMRQPCPTCHQNIDWDRVRIESGR